jgi:seryl-tRNA synthetase
MFLLIKRGSTQNFIKLNELFKAMLDINFVREHPNQVKDNEIKKNQNPEVVDSVLKLDARWRDGKKKVEKLKQTRNIVSEEINKAKKAKDEKTAKKKIKEMQTVASDIKKQEAEVEESLEKRNVGLGRLSNIMHESVPKGKDDSENVEIRKTGKTSEFKFPIKNHVELCESLGIANFDNAADVSGSGFYYLQGELGLLNQALIQFAIQFMHKKGYHYLEPPLMVRKEILGAAIDVGEWSDTIYSVADEDLALIGTSEHAILGYHNKDVFDAKDLPKKYFSYSMCFRKEIGAHGINEKGLWRTHQFNKVEQFIFCKPDESEKLFDELLQNSEDLLKQLKLPYRVLEICSGDLSAWKHKSYDIEVYRPTTKDYGEIVSLSNCTDYQARKLGIKFVNQENKREIVHTLNNTALATSRIMVAILENYQTKKGTVKIPKVLQPFMCGITEIGKR